MGEGSGVPLKAEMDVVGRCSVYRKITLPYVQNPNTYRNRVDEVLTASTCMHDYAQPRTYVV